MENACILSIHWHLFSWFIAYEKGQWKSTCACSNNWKLIKISGLTKMFMVICSSLRVEDSCRKVLFLVSIYVFPCCVSIFYANPPTFTNKYFVCGKSKGYTELILLASRMCPKNCIFGLFKRFLVVLIFGAKGYTEIFDYINNRAVE